MENFMESIRETWHDPNFMRFLIVFGGIIFVLNLIRLLVVICKTKKAKTYLCQGAEAFHGMSVGCAFAAIGGFARGMQAVGLIAAIFAFIFFCCDNKFIQLYHSESATQEAQAMLDAKQS